MRSSRRKPDIGLLDFVPDTLELRSKRTAGLRVG
jgi:hypothetical protein